MSKRELDRWLRVLLAGGKERWRISHVLAVAEAEELGVTWGEIQESARRVGVHEHHVGGYRMWALISQREWNARARRCPAFA